MKKPQKRDSGDWELIDGQQRLTTLWLIFNDMHKGVFKRSGAAFSLRYETRPGSQQYLHSLDIQQSTNNIDYFHLRAAHDATHGWFHGKASNDHARDALEDQTHGYLSTSVHVIWYEVPEHKKPIPLFTRLNQGRIPLTDAELLRAVLLTQVAKNHQGREAEIAAQWDVMERDLQRPEVWAFVAGSAHHDTHSAICYSTRISLLFDTLAQQKTPVDGNPKPFHTFDTLREPAEKRGLAFWEVVEALHAQILGWLEEPHWYKRIGFLVSCGMPIGAIQRQALGSYKQAFDN